MSVIHTIRYRTWTSVLVGLFLLCVSAYVVVSHPFRADAGGAPEPPTISFFKASSNTYGPGYSEVILWWRASAASCSGNNFTVSESGTLSGFFGYVYGSARVTPGMTTTYTLVCSGPGGSVSSSVTITYNATPPSAAPSAPTVSGPTSGTTNNTYTYTFSGSTDPEGGTIRYGIDWNNDGLTDTYTPASGYLPSGSSSSSTISWSDSGSKTFRVSAEDASGMVSAWTTYTATITGASLYTWTQQTGAGTGSMWSASQFSDGSHFVVYNNGVLWGSADGGATWSQKNAVGITSPSIFAASADGMRIAAVNDSDKYVYSSLDGGNTWVRRDSAGSRGWISIAASGDGSRFVARENDVGYDYYSSDAGITWAQGSVCPNYCYVSRGSFDGSVFMAAEGVGAFFEPVGASASHNGGMTWGSLPVPSTISGTFAISALSSNGQRVFAVAGPDYFYVSSDGGQTWAQNRSLGFAVWSIASSDNGNVLAAISRKNEGGYIYVSRDGGITWSPQTVAGARQWVTVVVSSDGSRILAGAGGVLSDGYSPVYDYLWTGVVSNLPPAAPTITPQPTSGIPNTNYTFTFTATDPEDNQIQYGIDWDYDGITDDWLPSATTYVASGVSQQWTNNWGGPGLKQFGVVARDSSGATSATTVGQITINAIPTATLSANASTYRSGDPAVTLTWSSTDAGSGCVGSNFTTLDQQNGTANVTPSATTEYGVTCTGPGGSAVATTSVTLATPYCYVPAGTTPITGYAWSDGVGWVDLNCLNSDTCGTYNFGMAIDADGTIWGCGWSDVGGWLSASQDDVNSCPAI